MKKNITEKEFAVLAFLINSDRNYNWSVHGTLLTKIIFDSETIEKYNHTRGAKRVIDTMTFSYLGKMCNKDLIWSEYNTQRYSNGKRTTYYVGHYCTSKGKEEYEKYLNTISAKKE